MRSFRRVAVAAVAVAAVAGSTATNATAADSFGHHVATCAHELGKRADAPAVTCTHAGVAMTFANFGAMVEHMRAMH